MRYNFGHFIDAIVVKFVPGVNSPGFGALIQTIAGSFVTPALPSAPAPLIANQNGTHASTATPPTAAAPSGDPLHDLVTAFQTAI
jgi:hypothetical protein